MSDLDADPRWSRHAAWAVPLGLRACWAEPIPDRGTGVSGALALYLPRPGAPDDCDDGVLAALAGLVGLAVKAAQKESAFRTADESFDSLASTIPGVVYQRVVTPEGDIRYTYVSEGAREIFGVSAQEILADPEALFSRHGEDYRKDFRRRLLDASRALSLWDVEASIVTADGRRKYTHAIARPKR